VIEGEIHWLTSEQNKTLLEGLEKIVEIVPWTEHRRLRGRSYDLVINLEDSAGTAALLSDLQYGELFGAYLNSSGNMGYSESSKEWFDLSLISKFGKSKADELKLQNRTTYQEMLFKGLGYSFLGQPYHLPQPHPTDLAGDVAIASDSGSVWPMKKWAYYEQLKSMLEERGHVVNYLPLRTTINQHINDVQSHKYLISGDTLPMHIALGSGIKCVSIFICTSPWEIYGYGLQRKVVSPLLTKYFYKRGYDREAVESISVDHVLDIVLNHLDEH
jgi:heptosyltransferase-2